MKSKFFIFGLMMCLLQLSTSCIGGNLAIGKEIEGNGTLVTKSYNFETFDKIGYAGKMDVEYQISESENSMQITTDENILEFLDIKLKGGLLSIEPKREKERIAYNLQPTVCKVIIKSAALKEVNGAGDNTLTVNSNLSGNRLTINLAAGSKGSFKEVDSSSFDFNMAAGATAEISNLKADKGTVNMAAGGEGTFTGKVDRCEINIAAGGDFNGFGLEVNDATCSVAAGGTIEINAIDKLDISIAAGGNVSYKGNPKVSKSIAGGKVNKID